MKRFTPLGLALSLALAYPLAGALPQGAQVVQGQVTVSPGLIQQASDKAIVNWQSFSIAAGQTLRVQQPGLNSVLLNRVVGGDPSLILGQLQANGRVFLVNPRGIVFGRGSQVDVGGLVASTLDLSDTDFLTGAYRFSAGAQAGALQADGHISAPGGTVALVAPQLDVGGSIAARRVGLAAAGTVQVDVEGDGLVLFNLRHDDRSDPPTALKFSGRVLAESSAELRAQARAGAAGQVLNMDGIVQARGLRQQGGRIVIDGGTAGLTRVNGSVDATGEQGGSITLLGQQLALLDGARVDASGRLGGGSILAGGGFQGQGTAHNAERTWVAAGATLRADATESGDGGRVAVWADQRTDFFGHIWARGGRLGGNGGTVETSGRERLNVLGGVDASAPHGRPGQWLLDPNDVVIKANGGASANVGAAPNFSTTDDAAIVDVGALNTALTGGTTVTVQTLSAGTNAQAGNIDVQAAIVSTGLATLKLLAEGNILFSSGSIGAGTGALNVELDAKGSITGTTLNTGGGHLKATALGAINLGAVTVNDLIINGAAGTVTLPSGTVGRDLTVNTAGSIGQAVGALAVTRDATLTTTGAAAVTLGSFDSRALTVSTAGGPVTLGTGTLAGALDVTSGGGLITQAGGGLTVNGTAALRAGAGDITLTEANNDLQGVVALTGAVAHLNSSKTAGSLLQLGAGSLSGNLVANTAGGAISQTGVLAVGGSSTLNAGSGNITLAGLSSHGLTLRSTGGTVTLGTGTVTGALDVASGGGPIQQVAGGFTVTSTSVLNAGAGAIVLAEGNDLQDTVTLTGAATQIASSKTAASVLKLGTSTLSGNFSAATGGGAIVQTGPLSVTGTARFDAGSGDITLAGLSTGALTALSTDGNIVLGHGTVAALTASTSSNGAITQASGSLSVTGSATVTGGAGGVVLGSFSSAGLDVSATSGNLTLGTGTITGPLTVSTGAGNIGQSGALTVTGDATLSSLLGDISLASLSSTGLLSVSSGGGALTLPTGSVGSTLTASTGGAGGITQAAGSLTVGGLATLSAGSGGITLGNLQANGLDASANGGGIQLGTGTLTGVLTVDSGGGAITQGGALSVTGNATLAAGAGSVTLGSFGSGGNVGITSTAGSITLGAGTISGTLTASTAGTGAITQAGATTVGGLATLTAGSGGVSLSGFDSQGLSLTATGGGVRLGTGTLTGNVSVSSGGTAITQAAGGLVVTGTLGLTAGAGSITLAQAGNDLQDTVTLTGAATHLVSSKTAASVLKLGSSTISSTLLATTLGGAITQTGTLSVTGSATLNAGSGSITLAGLSTGQLNLSSTAGQLTLGNGTVAGLSASTGGSGSIVQAAGSLGMAGAATLTTATGAITLGSFGSGSLSATTSGGAVTLGAGNIAGTLAVTTAGGTLGQAAGGLSVNGTATLNAGSGIVTLDQGNNLQGAITLTGGATQITNAGVHALTLASVSTSGTLGLTTGGGDITLAPGSVTGALNVSSGGGAVSQAAGALSVSGLATLNAGAGTLTLGSFSSGGLSATTAGGALTLGTGTITGTLTAASGGGTVGQAAGGLTVTGAASVNAGAADITLAEAANDWRGAVTLTGATTQVTSKRNATATLTLGTLNTGNLTVGTAGGALNLGQGTVTGTLDATSAGGPITQTAALSVSGITTLNATIAGDITLANTSNQWHGLHLTGNALDLRSNGDLEILSLTQPANRALTLSAGADLILGPSANIDTGTANLKLASLGGLFTVGGVLKGKDVELQAHSGIRLSKNLTATGDLKLTTAGGGITQTTGIIAVTGTTAVDAGSSTIGLAGANNDFGGAVSLTGGATTLTDVNALTLGTLATGNLTVSATGALGLGKGTVTGTLNANSLGGGITQASGAGSGLTLTGTTTLNAGTADITLTETGNDLRGAITTTGGGVSLYSSGDLNLFARTPSANKPLVLEALGTLTLPSGTTNIDTGTAALTLSSGGVFATFGTLKGGNVTLKGQSATLAHDITATGNLDLRTTTGVINQTGGRLSVTGTSLFNAATFNLTLNRPLNSFGGAVSLTGGAADIRSQAGLTLSTMAVSSLTAQAGGALQLGTGTLSGTLTATAGGAITQAAGGLRVTGASSFSGSGGVTLLDTTNAWTGAVSLGGGAAQLYGSGPVTLGGGSLGSLVLTSGGTVSQTGALSLGGGLTVNAGGAGITLANGSNQLGGTVTLTGGTTQLSTGGALSLGSLSVGALTLQSSGNLNLGQGSIGGTLVANSGGGAVSQSGVLNVSGTADIQAGSGSITLTQGGNQWGGTLSLGGSAAQVNSNAGLSLGTLGLASLQVDANGALGLGQGSVSGGLTANSRGGTLTQSGALTVGGVANLQAGGGAITLTQAGNRFAGVVQLTGGTTQLSASGGLALGTLATGNLTATATGALNLGQGVVGGDLVASSGGPVTQAGALQVSGSTTLNAAGADITLTNTGNRFSGPMNLSGGAVTLFNQPSLVLGTLAFSSLDATSNGSVALGTGSITGALTAKALGGTLTQAAGGLSVGGSATLQASAAITLADTANRLQGLVNLAGGVTTLTNAGALRLGRVATGALTLRATGALDLGAGSVAGNLQATSGGALTQTGALSVSGATALDAGSAPITLGQAGNALAGPVSLSGGNALLTNAGALSLGSLSVGDLTLQSGGALQLGTGTVRGELKATSGSISQAAGGLAVGGASMLNAGSATVQLADAANAFTGLVTLTAGDVTLANATALRLGSFNVRSLVVSAGGDLDLGAGSASGSLSATTRGSRISQTGPLTVQGSATFIADGGPVDLVLDQPANQLLGPLQMLGVNGGSFLSASFSTAGDLSFTGDVQALTLRSGGRLTLGGGRSTTLTAAARTGIVQTGALDVSGSTTLIAQGGAALPVDLSHAGNELNTVTLEQAAGGSFGRVQLRDGDARRRDGLRVGGDAAALEITSAGALDLLGGRYVSLLADTSAGGAALTQSGALAVSGVATLKAGGGNVTLDRADNRFAQVDVVSAGLARLVSLGDYRVGAGSVAAGLVLGGPGALTLAGPLAGAGELVMSGSGSLTISSAQAYSGGTRLTAGRLVLQGPAAQAGTGAVRLGAAAGLDLRDGATLASELIAQGGSVFNTAGSATLAGPVTLQATTRFMPGAGGLTISGAIDDGGAGFGLQLASAGTLTLSGPNRFGGTTDITAGTLRATGAGALPVTSAVQLAAGATLALGADQAIGSLAGAGRVALGSFTLATGADGRDTGFSGSLDGSGGLNKRGSGRFTLSGNGAHGGATRVEGGELVLASATALNDRTAVTVEAGALLTVQQDIRLGSLAGAGTVDVQAALLSVGANGGSTRWDGALIGSGGLAKLGAGTFTLAGRNTLAGDVQVSAGTLQIEGSGRVRPQAAGLALVATGPVLPASVGVDVAGGATLALLTDIELGALTGAGQVALGAQALTLGASGRSGRFDGVMAGTGSLTKRGSGTLTLGGANRYTGATAVEDGALVLDTAQALAGASALVIHAPGRVQANAAQAVASLNGTGSLQLNGAALATGADGADSRFDGLISGSGGLVKQGAGTLVLTAANSHSGAGRIEAGTLQLSGQGSLGSGDLQNDGRLLLSRSEALTLGQALSGRGSLVITQGQVTLASTANSYTGATQVQGGSLVTPGAERLPDASAVQVAAGAQLQLGGAETMASLQAAGSVRLAGNLTTRAEQVYTGSLTLANPAGVTLAGTLIDASRSSNQFNGTPLGLAGGQALVAVKETLTLGDVSLSNGGRIEAERLALAGKLQLGGGSLSLVATAAPDDAKAALLGTAQVPVAGQPLAVAEATVQQGSASAITLAEAASLQVTASGGGSVLLGQDANSFKGLLAVLSGPAYNTAWVPNAKGAQAIQSLVRVAGQQVRVGGSGIEADLVSVRADQLATSGAAALVARLPFDEIVLGRALSAPGMTLELSPGAFGLPGSFGAVSGQAIQVVVGSTETGGRTAGPNAGYLTVLPKSGAQGVTAVVLTGPKVGSVPAVGGAGYRFFHDGASQATEIPVVYNGVLPLTPAASGAISSINGDAEDARRARFQETVRTENVTVRLRSGVIAEVGPGRASTQGSEGAKPPELCDPADKPALSCKPSTPTP